MSRRWRKQAIIDLEGAKKRVAVEAEAAADSDSESDLDLGGEEPRGASGSSRSEWSGAEG